MKNAIIIGSHSDIAQQLTPLLQADGWNVEGWARGELQSMEQFGFWDLCIVAVGRITPVGLWMDNDMFEWNETMRSNLLLPIELLRRLWPKHNTGASVCWLAGSNPQMIMDGYSAYNVSKMAVLKAVEQLDHETPDAKFFALGPGIVNTKIHRGTLKAAWPNPKLAAAIEAQKFTPIERVYGCLKWCMDAPKSLVGGRNICASDPWHIKMEIMNLDADIMDLYKLRRVE